MAELTGKLLKLYNATSEAWKKQNRSESLDVVIQHLVSGDPSKTNKYVPIMLRILSTSNVGVDQLIMAVVEFANVENKISQKIFEGVEFGVLRQLSDGITKNPKDIQQYKTFHDFNLVQKIANKYITKNEHKNKIVEEETEVLYDEDDYKVVVPLTHKSSCFWGVETKWCTTSKDNPDYFSNYKNNGTLFYVIDKYRQDESEHPMSKFAVFIPKANTTGKCEIYNRPDIRICEDISIVLPERLSNVLMTYHLSSGINRNLIFDSFNIFIQSQPIFPNEEDRWDIKEPIVGNRVTFVIRGFESFEFSITLSSHGDEHVALIFRFREGFNTDYLFTIQHVACGKELTKLLCSGSHENHNKNHIWQNFVLPGVLKKIGFEKNFEHVKLTILNTIVFAFFNRFDFILDLDGWVFEIIDHNPNDEGGLAKGLGTYRCRVNAPIYDLSDYSVVVDLDFRSNEFVIHGGETNLIRWETQKKGFILLYFTESGITNLLWDFRKWVMDTMEKTDKIVLDIYDDMSKKIKLKQNAFNKYLDEKDYFG